jgi:O-antigen ligase
MSKKTNSYQKNSKSKTTKRETSALLLMPLMAVVGIVPLIVRLYVYDCLLEYFDFFQNADDYLERGGTGDLFLRWKMVWFVVFSAIMASILIFKLVTEGKKLEFHKIFLPLGVYALLAILSSVLSDYRRFSFTGIYEQFEPLWALLGYCIVIYYAFLFVQTEHDVKMVLWALAFSTVIMIYIGITQAFFTDFFKTMFAAKLVLPSWAFNEDGTPGMDFTFEKGRVYLTLYNPNYVGSYVAILMPIFLMLIFGADKVWKKIGAGLITAGLILSLLASGSRAGLIGTVVSVIAMMIIFNKRLFKHWIAVLVTAALLVGVVAAYGHHTNYALLNRLKGALHPAKQTFNLTSIKTLDEEVIITYKENNLHGIMEYNSASGAFDVRFKDDAGKNIETVSNSENVSFTLQDDRFPGFRVIPVMLSETQVGFELTIDGHGWYFARVNGTYYLFTPYGKFVKTVDTESVDWLVERSRAFSGRAYIWGKTIPLLKHYAILGSGADTFVIAFPNYDFVSMYNGGYATQTMTKPHNMYLQIGVQTGVLSLIAILAFYFWFFVYGLGTCFRLKKYDLTAFVGAGVLAGSAGYMVVQIINDSSITVAPVYWTMVGVGLAIFRNLRKSDLYVAKVPKEKAA